MKVAVITDSGSNLSKKYIDAISNLEMCPLMINIEGKFYRDILEISPEETYEKLKHSHVKTSLPNLEDFVKAIDKFKKIGYTDIIVITISSGLSGTYNGFKTIANDIEDINIHLFDSKTLGMTEGILVEKALELIEKGTEIKDILDSLTKLRFQDSFAIFTVETLKHLRRGGRIGLVEGTIGEILHIKPIIAVNDDGVYHTLSKGFGMKRTIITMRNKLKDFCQDNPVEITVHYGDNLEEGLKLESKIKTDLNVKKITTIPVTPVLGVHTGPKILAVVAKKL